MLLSKQFLLHDPIRHAGILEVLRRGTAIIKEDLTIRKSSDK